MAQSPSELGRIRLLLLDVDGVLTDGGIYFSAGGEEWKRFYVRDGAGIVWWRRAGHRVAILSGRSAASVEARARELGIDPVLQGVDDKLGRFGTLCEELEVKPDEVCFVGDDLPDLPLLRRVGYAVAPADACAEVREAVHWVAPSAGGSGAVRDTIEHMLRGQGRWDDVVARYLS